MRAVLFDLDGVLVDSEPLWDEIIESVLHAVGGHVVGGSEWNGLPTLVYLRKVVQELGLQAEPEALASEIDARYRARIASVRPMLGAIDAVRAVQRRYPTGLVSRP